MGILIKKTWNVHSLNFLFKKIFSLIASIQTVIVQQYIHVCGVEGTGSVQVIG